MERHTPKDLSRLPEPLRKMVERLNAAVNADRGSLSTLFSQSVPGGHFSPFFVTMGPNDTDCTLGPLGMLNGLLEVMGYSNYRVYREVDERTDEIEFFGVLEGWDTHE